MTHLDSWPGLKGLHKNHPEFVLLLSPNLVPLSLRFTSDIPCHECISFGPVQTQTRAGDFSEPICCFGTSTQPFTKFQEFTTGTKLCAERWCCLSSLLGYWTQSWTGRHSDTGYQQAGTHFADLGRMTDRVNPTWY